MNAIEKYELWCDKLGDSHELSEELKSLKGNTKEIEERFAQDVAFGTAGLRGKVGAGSFCMNSLVVGRATQGLILSGKMARNSVKEVLLSVMIADIFQKNSVSMQLRYWQQMESGLIPSLHLDPHRNWLFLSDICIQLPESI